MNPYSTADAGFDNDGDGFTALQEFIAGSSVISPTSYHSVTSIQSASMTNALIAWTGVSGRYYQVQFSTNLLEASDWSPLVPFTNLSGSGALSITDTSAMPFKAYRIDVSKP
jgi:hypothetical protein